MSITLTPSEAVDGFLEEKREEVSQSTWRNYKYPLNYFIEFCEKRDIEHVNDLTGYHLKQFKTQRRKDGIGNVTLRNNLSVLHTFLRWCEQAELLDQGFHELVQSPKMRDGELVSKETPELDYIEDILDYLYKFEYGTRRHAIFQLI